MKKSILALALAAPMFLAVSCNTDDVPDQTQSYNLYVTNIVTPLNGDGVSEATEGSYSFNMNLTKLNMAFQAHGINTATGALTAFKVDNVPFKVRMENCLEYSFSIKELAAGTATVNNLQGYLTSNFFWPNATMIADPMIPYDPNPGLSLLLNYRINDDYEVTTIPAEMLFVGTTSTTTSALDNPFTTEEGAYRIVPNFKTKKAAILFYNVQFNGRMPKLSFQLQDLDIVMTKGGFSVVGENVAPVMPNGVVAEQFAFKDIKATVNGRFLNHVDMKFNVADSYSGMFDGYSSTILK